MCETSSETFVAEGDNEVNADLSEGHHVFS